MADEPTREQMLETAQTVRSIIDYQQWRDDVRGLVEDIHRPGSPIEFLCLSVGGSRQAVPDLREAARWVERYRADEARWMQNLSHDERARLPIGILVATDPPPSEAAAWREDCEVRENLGTQGAMLLDRPKSRVSVRDDDLFLEIIAVAIGDPASVPKPSLVGGFDFGWTPGDPVGSLGAEYGRQPSSIDPPDKDLFQRFDAYSPDSPDLEY